MEEKRQDLKSEQQRVLLERLVADLSSQDPNFYYQSTVEIAHRVRKFIANDAQLNADESALVKDLSARDIQILLSLHH